MIISQEIIVQAMNKILWIITLTLLMLTSQGPALAATQDSDQQTTESGECTEANDCIKVQEEEEEEEEEEPDCD